MKEERYTYTIRNKVVVLHRNSYTFHFTSEELAHEIEQMRAYLAVLEEIKVKLEDADVQ